MRCCGASSAYLVAVGGGGGCGCPSVSRSPSPPCWWWPAPACSPCRSSRCASLSSRACPADTRLTAHDAPPSRTQSTALTRITKVYSNLLKFKFLKTRYFFASNLCQLLMFEQLTFAFIDSKIKQISQHRVSTCGMPQIGTNAEQIYIIYSCTLIFIFTCPLLSHWFWR